MTYWRIKYANILEKNVKICIINIRKDGIALTGKTHLTFGIGTGVLAATLINPDSTALGIGMMGMTMLGSLAPDIDSRTSKISKKMKVLSVVTSKMFGHRGFIHSPICMLLIYFVTIAILNKYNATQYVNLLYAFLIGYGGHLFLDLLTKGGIPLLYPFSRKKFHLTNFKTGGKAEKILFIFACFICITMVVVYFAYGDTISAEIQYAINKVIYA